LQKKKPDFGYSAGFFFKIVKIWKVFETEKFSEVFIRKEEISKISQIFLLIIKKRKEKLSPKENKIKILIR